MPLKLWLSCGYPVDILVIFGGLQGVLYSVCMVWILPKESMTYVEKFNQPLRGPLHYYCYYYYSTLDVCNHALCVYYYEIKVCCYYYTVILLYYYTFCVEFCAAVAAVCAAACRGIGGRSFRALCCKV